MADLSSFYEGTTKVFSVTILHNGAAPNIISDTVRFIVKKNLSDADASALINTTADVTTSGSSGIAIFTLSSEQTEIAVGTYYYEITWGISATKTGTISIANPAIVTCNSHGLSNNQRINFTTTGTLPGGLTVGTNYYVDYIDTNTFHVTATPDGDNIETTGTQTGTHTLNYFSSYYVLQSSKVEVLEKLTDNI